MKKVLSIMLALSLALLCVVSCNNDSTTVSLSSIKIKTNPTKTIYQVGETLDTTGMVLTATYTDGSTVDDITAGFTVNLNVFTNEHLNTEPVITVTYTAGGVSKTATFKVTVTDKKFTVVFDVNGATGTTPTQQEAYLGKSVTIPQKGNLAKTGYTFCGWNTSKSGTGTNFGVGAAYSQDTAGTVTLYAKWVITKGTGLVDNTTCYNGREKCGWVQLWDDGPKWAEFNIGSTINDYAVVKGALIEWLGDGDSFYNYTDPSNSAYCLATCGGHYGWLAIENKKSTSATYGTNDTAADSWGKDWQMPTLTDFSILIDGINTQKNDFDGTYTKWEWCDGIVSAAENDGHKQYVGGCTLAGWKISGIGEFANNSIFLPAAGCFDSSYDTNGIKSYYWTKTNAVDATTGYYFQTSKTGSTFVTDILTKKDKSYSVRAVYVGK